jgi:signal peptidase I
VKYSPLGLNQSQFSHFSFVNGFNKGDILFIVGVSPKDVKIGNVIIFNAGQQAPVIHRVVNITQINGDYYFSTVGDNNNGQLNFEQKINQNQLVGKAVFRIAPYIGWAKLIFYEYQKPPTERGLCQECPYPDICG